MRRLSTPWLLSLLLLAAGTAAAAPPDCRVGSDAAALLLRTGDWTNTPETTTDQPRPLTTTARVRTAASQATVEMVLDRPADFDLAEWGRAVFIGSARTRDRYPPLAPGETEPDRRPPQERVNDGPLAGFVVSPVEARLRARDDKAATVSLEVPDNRSGLFKERWRITAVACSADLARVLAYGSLDVTVSPYALSVGLTLGAVALLWVLLAAGAAGLHARRLESCWQALAAKSSSSRWWKTKRSLSPVFISQDLLGIASLSQLQLLLFTMAVVGVSLYVYLRNGTLPGLSPDVLQLLGIAAAGTTFARLTQLTTPLSTRNRALLVGNGIVLADDRLPRWTDLVANNGIIDITRVQAIAFTGFAILALVVNGTADLASFKLPDYLNWLLGISQGVYVAGKLVPSENLKRLDDSLEELRRTARAAFQSGMVDGSPEMAAFLAARRTAEPVILDVFEARYQPAALAALTPREVS